MVAWLVDSATESDEGMLFVVSALEALVNVFGVPSRVEFLSTEAGRLYRYRPRRNTTVKVAKIDFLSIGE